MALVQQYMQMLAGCVRSKDAATLTTLLSTQPQEHWGGPQFCGALASVRNVEAGVKAVVMNPRGWNGVATGHLKCIACIMQGDTRAACRAQIAALECVCVCVVVVVVLRRFVVEAPFLVAGNQHSVRLPLQMLRRDP